MATIFPIDDYVSDEFYPGFPADRADGAWVADAFRPFAKADEERFWFLDFHWPRGLTPLGLIWNEDGYAWGTQLAAETMPLPPGRGIAQRLAGTHTYVSGIPVTDPHEIEARAKRLSRTLPAFLDNFDDIWQARREEVEAGWERFFTTDLTGLSLPELGANLRAARQFHKRSFEIHFEVLYPLLANYVSFYGVCLELELDPSQISRFLQGYDTRIMETDRQLWALTSKARRAGLEDLFAHTEPERLRAELAAHGGTAAGWLTEFDDFLRVYGWRTEGSCDVALPSWVEDPTPALGMVKTFLQKGGEHDFDAARDSAVVEREEAIDAARTTLTREQQALFDGGLESCRKANLPWWMDDHNFYIDLRVSLPMRWAALEIARRVGADRADDTLFLFWPELVDVVEGERSYASYRGLIEARRQYFDHWYARRASMPKALGTVPDSAAEINDPALIDTFGINDHFLTALRLGTDVTSLTGVPASKGTARGTARVLTDADDLHRLSPGDILVCESTSPNWTPAFAKIAACVCDGGGMLSHAAIVGREYGVPTVTAVGTATVAITDGDEIEVDGSTGVVTITRAAAVTAPA